MRALLKLLSYPRAYIVSIFIVFHTLFWSIVAILSGVLPENRKIGDFVVSTWARILLWLSGVKVEVEGLENIPESGGIYIFNHSSHFDIPVICQAVPVSLRFGAKAELFKIPFFGTAMRSFGMLEIHRAEREKVLELYKKSLAKVSRGYNYILAPEGTRKDGQKIYPFKSGPFIMAISGQLPVVPLVLIDVWKAMPKGELFPNKGTWRRVVKVKVLPSIPSMGLTLEQRSELQERAHAEMSKAYTAQ